mmetsp:Transcript_70038/g.164321  ORF Transcript_70038/g.164321 Transcript_70038/m.164321 type:complete len:226 (-) Transcript_70038:313-990(-)
MWGSPGQVMLAFVHFPCTKDHTVSVSTRRSRIPSKFRSPTVGRAGREVWTSKVGLSGPTLSTSTSRPLLSKYRTRPFASPSRRSTSPSPSKSAASGCGSLVEMLKKGFEAPNFSWRPSCSLSKYRRPVPSPMMISTSPSPSQSTGSTAAGEPISTLAKGLAAEVRVVMLLSKLRRTIENPARVYIPSSGSAEEFHFTVVIPEQKSNFWEESSERGFALPVLSTKL